MTPIDLAFGLLAGILSCLNPASLLLLPLMLCAIGTRERPFTLALGLGASLVGTGKLASLSAAYFGMDATLFRRLDCIILASLGCMLLSQSLSDRFSLLTGGSADSFSIGGHPRRGRIIRQFLLALLIGANWLPLPSGPTLTAASSMAADARMLPLSLGTLFAFGVGAALPWIILGRLLRPLSGLSGGREPGAGGMVLFGFALILVAIAGLIGFDATMTTRLLPLLPPWVGKAAVMF